MKRLLTWQSARFPNTFLLALFLAAGLSASLSACLPLVAGGAFAGGLLIATDRRTSGAQLEDEGIELRASTRVSDALKGRGRVSITSYNRRVLLTGELASTADKDTIAKIVEGVPNVREVLNETAVLPESTFAQRSSDTLITGKIRASLIDDKFLHANSIKVVTSRSNVYLMGLLTDSEAKRASDIARSVSGVTKVVIATEQISEEEKTRLQPPPPAQNATTPKPAS